VRKIRGTQKINMLHKAGGRVVYFEHKHQRKVEKKFSDFNEKLKGVVKKDKKLKEIQKCPYEKGQEEIQKNYNHNPKFL
jgi:hypothetical protein